VPLWSQSDFRRCIAVEDFDDVTTTGVSCPDCHALVTDLAAHKQWHSRLVASIANAVESEIKRTAATTG
jgi:hypothetical protein